MSEAIAQNFGFSELLPREAAQRPDLIAVDVRQPEELSGPLGHIPGATHIPLDRLLSAGAPADWERDAPLLLVCRSGARSTHAAMQLAQWGFTRLHNLTGGMIAWNGARLPVARQR
ncbi:MAG TPA: rhodanese-like domain-containing protein [bacterium]|jgi:rhodanese-related sulfurtransferase